MDDNVSQENRAKVFGEQLRRLRNQRGLTLRDVEAQAGISASYLAQIEKGDRNPPKPPIIKRLARLYQTSLNGLLRMAGFEEVEDDEAWYADQINRAFDWVVHDRDYQFGTQMVTEELSLAAKRFIVEMYTRATGIDLLRKIREREATAQDVDE